ncbi:MAG: DUF481 domain-containing protein [Acidobacteria bacterium]|nr:MAG: DUF481 domain-containing protein [Acidobacteriota bacterium]
MRFVLSVLAGLCLAIAAPAAAQTAPLPETLKVFLDCADGCDFDYLRRQIDFVDYVRDRRDADVHVLVTTQGTGTGGREYTIQFIGLGEFQGHEHRAHYVSSGSDTSDERRRGFSQIFSLGLTSYLLDTAMAGHLRIERIGVRSAPTTASAAGDKWNLWIFRLGASTDLRGERSDSSRQFRGNFSASRTTERWKLSFVTEGQYNRNIFTLSDGSELSSESHNYNIRAVAVKSLDRNHWALVGRLSTGDSTQNNYARNSRAAAGIEYSVFPYDQSTSRQLIFQLATGLNRFEYIEPTIYDLLEETRPDASIQGVFAFRQPWGFASFSVEHISYLHDLSKRRTELDGRLDLRLFRGLSLNTNGKLSLVHDQLYLRAGSASDEEILLRRQRLQTSYRYEFSVGFSYQFGSIFNNVVNPRWDR